jgi:peptidoglycan/xylan/chitin deacetylase (PgdA/CDA1 family)
MAFNFLNYLTRQKLQRNIYILTYHGIVEERKHDFWERNFTLRKDFEDHLRFFSKYQILSTAELTHYIETNTYPAKPSFYITFDDGYKNNLTASELLKKKNIPWSLFITTQNISTGEYIWTIDLALLFRFTSKRTMVYNSTIFDVSVETSRILSFNIIRRQIKSLPADKRLEQIMVLQKELGIIELESLRRQIPEFEMLNWKEVTQISSYAEIGSHGITHELMHPKQQDDIVAKELHQSKKTIENNLGKPCYIYAYPNGDFSNYAIKNVQEAGYKLAFTTIQTHSQIPYNPMLLPRIDAVNNLVKLKTTLSHN